MRNKFTLMFVLIALLAFVVAPVFAQDETPTIAETVIAAAAAEDAEFTILLEAVLAADPAIVEALSDPAMMYTVFAPTDEAFVAALETLGLTAEELLADTETLTRVLAVHVVPAVLGAEDVVALDGAVIGTLLNGAVLPVVLDGDAVTVGGSNVVAADIVASNGIIHVIDSVLLPPAPVEDDGMDYGMEDEEIVSIAETVIAAAAAEEPEFTTLLAAVLAVEGVADVLTINGPFTVFAPTDAAFAAALEALEISAEDLLADPQLVAEILSYHIVPGTFYASDVVNAVSEGAVDFATGLNGTSVSIALDGDNVMVNDATVIAADIPATNGVIHVIDSVLLPPAE